MNNKYILMLAVVLLCGAQQVQADPNVRKAVSSTKKVTAKKVNTLRGYRYDVARNTQAPFSYTRRYQKNGRNVFSTTYNVYDQHNKAFRNIVAVHDKANKRVEVTVRDLTRNGFPVLNQERTSYATPFMGRFGFVGKVGAIGNAQSRSTAPGQLQVKFASRRFDYIKVVHISGAHEDSGADLSVYVLDEKS